MLDDQPDVNQYDGKAPGRFSGTDRISQDPDDSSQSDDEGMISRDVVHSNSEDQEDVQGGPSKIPIPGTARLVSSSEIIEIDDPPVFHFSKPRNQAKIPTLPSNVGTSAENTGLHAAASVAAGAAALRRQIQSQSAKPPAHALEPDSSSIASSDAEDLAAKAIAVAEAAEKPSFMPDLLQP